MPSPPPKRQLLLVEDDRVTYGALRMIFTRRGWNVIVATTLAEALACINHSLPDAIILDLMLPDGDGAAVLQKIRRQALPIPVVVTTGSSDHNRLTYVQSLFYESRSRVKTVLLEFFCILQLSTSWRQQGSGAGRGQGGSPGGRGPQVLLGRDLDAGPRSVESGHEAESFFRRHPPPARLLGRGSGRAGSGRARRSILLSEPLPHRDSPYGWSEKRP